MNTSCDDYTISGDQNISCHHEASPLHDSSMMDDEVGTPRCLTSLKAYPDPRADAERIGLPETPMPRLFIIHGNGDAEELISTAMGHKILENAAQDPLAKLLDGQDIGDGCLCHTVVQMRLPDKQSAVPPANALPEGIDVAESAYSMAKGSQVATPAPVPIREYRQFVEHPQIG